jgi:phosphoglycolate phosphatase-like HAD superfamily hydrolase
VREVFETLSRRGGKLALATDCKGPELKHYPSLLHIDEFIGAKPDPRIVGVALRKLGLTGHEAVMIGDTPYDAEAASGAGTAAVGVLTGGFSADALRGAVASRLPARSPGGLAPLRIRSRPGRELFRNIEGWIYLVHSIP